MQILSNIANYGLGMIISLRDDEKMTIRALRKILEQEEDLRNIVIQKLHMRIEMEEDDSEQSYDRDSLELLIEKLIKNNILKILYYPPGNVTPDEFFHRMFVSLQAMQYHEREKFEAERQDGGPQNADPDCSKILVLFNSLDQLGARFPLCVQEQLFIPGMVQVFAGSKVSSIFISVEELGVIAKRDGAEAARHYGLLPMADLILRIKMAEEVSSSEAIEMRVDRNAGGEPVGHKAWLELKTKGPNMGLRRIDDPSKKGK